MKKENFAGAGAVVAALASSACCWFPLLLLALGISGVAVAAVFERFRFVFLALAAGSLAVGFYLSYRRDEVCGPDGSCLASDGKPKRRTRFGLWLSSLLVVGFTLFPHYVDRVRPWFERSVAAASEQFGLPVGAAGDAGHDSTAEAQLAGEWVARLVVAPAETADVVLDVGRLSSRWAGEFDVLAFGAEDYPVSVEYAHPRVSLHFSGIDANFEGTLSPAENLIRGIATTVEQEHLLVFRRVGEERFSETFRALEAAADDPTRVSTLSPNGAELRERFNAKRGDVRLILLLSPT